MKKIFPVILIILLTSLYANSQSFYLSWNGTVLNETKVVNPIDNVSSDINFYAVVHNTSNSGANIKVLRNELSMVEGTSSFFKWGGSYYNDTINLSTGHVFVPAGGASPDSVFIAKLRLDGTTGSSTIEYTFYNIDDPDDNIKILVEFNSSPIGFDENTLDDLLISNIYPNPTSGIATINYDIPNEINKAVVVLYNIFGLVVKEEKIPMGSGSLKLNIHNLKSGIYFYSIILEDEVYSTDKLIVK